MVNVVKHLSSELMKVLNKLECLTIPSRTFQPNLTFASKARAYPNGSTFMPKTLNYAGKGHQGHTAFLMHY